MYLFIYSNSFIIVFIYLTHSIIYLYICLLYYFFLSVQVKLAHQESELTALLRKLPLRAEEMMVVREKANLICQGKLQRGAVLPIMLATFIFEVLCCPGKASKETKNDQQRKMDEDIGYMAAFCALGRYKCLCVCFF